MMRATVQVTLSGHGLTLCKLKLIKVLSAPLSQRVVMDTYRAAEVIRDKTRVRPSIWLTGIVGLVAVAGVGMAFPQNSLTAPIPNTVEMADMTWVEVRSAIQHGYSVAIVPTGGIEQNGPQMVLAKHDYIARKAANRIAQELGHALVTPVVSFVPQGNYDPPTGNMQYPGTLGIPEPVFAGVLEGIARSLKSAGFKTICFIGDHGPSQGAQAAVAAKLNKEWLDQATVVLHVADYYSDDAQIKYLREKGETPAMIGDHAGLIDTSELLAVHPQGVDLARLTDLPSRSEPTGHSGNPARSLAEYGTALLEIRIQAALRQIRGALRDRNALK